ncbi:pilus assembly protein TadG-related protein [Polaromonas sp. JS666]|uniref:pilus assembly protein TadG-related protein n=1 Tax=Polaromonas sp. (strain JS666 / ATCC BAA-500) TaxID=296591 RepID=UPI0000536F93|nr:pilus assembly protein TadG-related protein [Polaromonas sp. JS666]ABE44467.1 hypothetical protein Bpro_2551 [Polaromonas sp. JS666]
MKTTSGYRKSERGAVAIIFGLTVVVLFAMGGVVLDLGHLYIAKAELQNAADAAALAGAKDLNETTPGIDAAVATAQTISAKNKYNFSTDVTLALANIEFGPSPDGPWSSVATARAAPQGMTFIKVDTGLKVLGTYLMRVAGVDTVSTFGLAVAGRFVNNVTPIGVCAVDPATKTAKYSYTQPDGTELTELVEFGFRRGVTYNLFGLNPLADGPFDPYLLNPVDSPPSACNPANSSANFTAPFLCSGTSAIVSAGSGKVYTNTGLTAPLADSLNSRFGDPKALTSGKCIAASAPPDTNIREYPCKGPADQACVNPGASTPPPVKWMEKGADTFPNREFVALAGPKPNYKLPSSSTPSVPAPSSTFAQFPDYGVLWSYAPPYQFDATPTSKVGAAITPEQANLNPMYSTATPAVPYFNTIDNPTDPTNVDRYPATAGTGFPAGTPAAPYNQTSGPYFMSGGASGVRNRRILNIVLVDCTVAPVGPAACGEMTAVGVGKFFMQVKADFSGGPTRQLSVEFAGLVSPVPTSVIMLYK